MNEKLALQENHEPFGFSQLVQSIQSVDGQLRIQTARAVNVSVTIRNWLIGCYIREFEQVGVDRAAYGERLIEKLSVTLAKLKVSRVEQRDLRRYRQFYLAYPQIRQSLTAEFLKALPERDLSENDTIRESATAISGNQLIQSLSFTHISELLRCDEMQKRTFYEAESIRGQWSVRELRRQIDSLLYERSQLSIDKAKLLDLANKNAERIAPQLVIRDPYVFEFLGLKPKEVMSESHLEDQLLDKLQEFLIELGNGFCFEARQRRILIGDTYYFIDMVFYHRILKCHVLVDLKLESFSHENIGQLNTYVSWYDKNIRDESDNPPIGILLCADHDRALVEYALAGMDNALFVSKYQLQLPDCKVLQAQIEAERQRLTDESNKTDLNK